MWGGGDSATKHHWKYKVEDADEKCHQHHEALKGRNEVNGVTHVIKLCPRALHFAPPGSASGTDSTAVNAPI